METTRALMPRARQDELVVEELRDETLVYDLERHEARWWDAARVRVGGHVDGQTGGAGGAALVEEQSATRADGAVGWRARDRLSRAHLLSEPVTLPADRARYSRRQMLRTLRRVAGISLLLPVIESIVSPLAAAQASCVSIGVCQSFPISACGGAPICGDPGQCCSKQGQACTSKKC